MEIMEINDERYKTKKLKKKLIYSKNLKLEILHDKYIAKIEKSCKKSK